MVVSSYTTLFSFGTRPFLFPELTLSAPVSVIVVSVTELSPTDLLCSGWRAYSYNSEILKVNSDEIKQRGNDLRWVVHDSVEIGETNSLEVLLELGG